jgi:signal transduction histidine kinase/ActR/RegA family two-component response regulator
VASTEHSSEAEEGRRRWRMAFRQSPLPQVCYEAQGLFGMVRPEFEAGERRLGDLLIGRIDSTAEALRYLNIIEINRATSALLGLPLDTSDLLAGSFHESLFLRLCESLNWIGDDGVLPVFEAQLIRADGQVIDAQFHVRMPLDPDPPWSLCVATFIDVTEINRATRAEREARQAAETASRAKTDFLAVMSHEIRTPLNGLLGMAQAMERERLPRAQLDRLRVIQRSGAALRDLLDDMLDLSKIEAGKLELEIADFDAAGLAQEIHATFLPAARRKGIALELEIAESARGCFRGDASRLRQVLCKLVANAIKFTETGRVALTLRACDAGLCCVVSDTGPGIAADRLPQLFEKFVQADSSTTRRFGGAGLGLAICKELRAAMGGTVSAVSQRGVGSSFTVEIPLARAEADPATWFEAAGFEAVLPQGGVRILAAEDNSVNQLVLRTLLEQVGLAPVIVENGAQAVSAWRCGDWDLILMDIQMPVMDGPSAVRLIREEELASGRARTPIVALTANAMTHQIESYRAAGMDGVVAKPIDVAELFRAIGALSAAA